MFNLKDQLMVASTVKRLVIEKNITRQIKFKKRCAILSKGECCRCEETVSAGTN